MRKTSLGLFASFLIFSVVGDARAQEAAPVAQLYAAPAAAPSPEWRAFKRKRVQRIAMAGVGFGVFTAAYMPLAGIAFDTFAHGRNDDTARWFAAPIVGPFAVAAQELNPPSSDWFADIDRAIGVVLIFDGLIQAAGLILGVVGAATVPSFAEAPPPPPKITVAPAISPTFAGLSLTARF